MSEPSNLSKNLSKSVATVHCEITNLKVSIEHILDRLHALEEKRSTEVHNDAEIDRIVDEVIREDHDREINLDEPEDKGQCSVCNIFYSPEDLYVIDTKPSDDYYDIEEIYECKYCKEEGSE